MRNYVLLWYCSVTYSQINPTPPPDTFNQRTQYIIAPDEIVAFQYLDGFKETLDPAVFVVDGQQLPAKSFWLFNKDFVFELVNGTAGWWGFLNSDRVSLESPRDTWSHGH